MPKLPSCKKCGKPLEKNEKYVYSGKNYCHDCYTVMKLQGQQYAELIEYICKLYEMDKPNGFILKQIKEMHEEYNLPYSGITYTIWYSTEILGLRPQIKFGIAFVRKYYNDAFEFYTKQQENIKKMQSLEGQEIKMKVITNNRKKEKPTTLFNLNNLIGGDSD